MLVSKVRHRLSKSGLIPHLLGLLLRTRFQRAGILTVEEGWSLPRVVNRGGRIVAGNCAFFTGVRLECWRDAEIIIGSGTYLNHGVEVVAVRSVRIGRDCMIARDVMIMDSDQHPLPGRELAVSPVTIGDRVWIGARAIVLKGVTIGADAVIGAGAIVTKDVPARGVVVGPAAQMIRTLDAPDTPVPIGVRAA